MRIFRFVLGLGIVLVALWVILFEQLAGASANAFINARLATIYAPIAGEVQLQATTLGSVVAEDQDVATIEDSSPDTIRRDDIALELEMERAELDRIAARRDQLDERLAGLADRTETYRAARMADVEAALAAARERLELLRDGGLSQDELELADTIDPEAERTPVEPLTLPLAINYAAERVERLEVEREALSDGVFLGDGYNDAPFSEQEATALRAERTTLAAAEAAADARIAAYETRLSAERQSVNRLSSATLTSPVRGLIWELRSESGERIQRGMPLVTIANCGSVIVSLSVTESVFNSLEPGQSATFRPTGSQQLFAATISRLSGPGSETIYRNLAVSPSQQHLERHDVTLLVPGLRDDPEYGCAIGRTGRAFFDTRPLDGLRNLFR